MKRAILFLILGFTTSVLAVNQAIGQTKNIVTPMPPEINLVPMPARLIIFQDFTTKDLKVGRDKKEILIQECTDSLLPAFEQEIAALLPTVEFILIPKDNKSHSSKSLSEFLDSYQADLALGIASFRPRIEQGEVTVERNDDGNKDRTARYNMVAAGILNIYGRDSLIKSFPFSHSEFLSDRMVVSGLLAAGPSLVKNRKAAIKATIAAAGELAAKFVSQSTGFEASLFSMSELKELTEQLRHDQFDEVLTRAMALTSHEKSGVSARAHYYCAIVYHQRGDLAHALEHAEKASQISDMQRALDYYHFLKKYVEDNQVVWKR